MIRKSMISIPVILTLSVEAVAQGLPFAQDNAPSDTLFAACVELDVTDPVAVYDCLTWVSPERLNLGARAKTYSVRDRCDSIIGKYRSLVREAYKEVPERFPGEFNDPSCEVIAEVVYDMAGERPIWDACLNYDPVTKVDHFERCLMSYIIGTGNNMSEEQASAQLNAEGCDRLKFIYYRQAMDLAYLQIEFPDGTLWRLPENIEDISCLEISTITF